MSDANAHTGHDKKTAGVASQGVTPIHQQQPCIEQQEAELPHQTRPHVPKPMSERSSLWTRIQDSWITEFVALIVSACAIAAIAGLLSEYDEQELPSWNGVSLNSLVSWLTTAAGICMGYAAGASIAQLKWVWFAQEAHKMEDMRLFNGAGGVVGALELLMRLRVRHFAVVTLLAIILAIGLDPFSQNLIGFYDTNVVDADQAAIVTKGRWYDTLGPPRRSSVSATNPVLKANVNSAIVTLGQSTNASLPQFTCNTGNCTYSAFATLAYQTACSDLSDRINKNCTEYRCSVTISGSELRLSYDTIFGGNAILMATQVINSEDAVVYTNASTSSSYLPTVFQALRIDVNPYSITERMTTIPFNNETDVVAQECVIMSCVRSIEASVRHGVYSETVLDTYMEVEDSNFAPSGIMRPPWGPDKGIQPGDDNTFGVSGEVEQGMWEDTYPRSILAGNISTNDGGTGLLFPSDELQNILFANVSNLEKCPFTSRGKKDPFACAINAVADAYTQTIRDAGYVANGTASVEGLARGETLVTRTFIRVEWPWIALHVAVWLLTAVGWVGTVWRTKGLGIPFWRSDPMPMVYMYSAAQQQGQRSAVESRSSLGMDMEAGGDGILMRLRNENGHMRLVREA